MKEAASSHPDLIGIFSRVKNYIFFAVYEQGRLKVLRADTETDRPRVGDIYKSQIIKKVDSVGCAFLNLLPNTKGALFEPLEEGNAHSHSSLLVQVKKEGYQHKHSRVSTQIEMKGRFLIYMPQGPAIVGCSQKIKGELSRTLKDALTPHLAPHEGAIVRSASAMACESLMIEELNQLRKQWKKIQKKMKKDPNPCGLLFSPPSFIIEMIHDYLNTPYRYILVDDLKIYKVLSEYLQNDPLHLLDAVKLIKSPQTPLFFSHGISEDLQNALKTQKWLPSGGSLSIEITEAFISIDINTSRYSGDTLPEETAYQVNLEAASEIPYWISLLNLAGLIIIDFIDMEKEEYQEHVHNVLKQNLKYDNRISIISDFSKLGIVEISRKRSERSLLEKFFVSCPNCEGTGYTLDPIFQETHASYQNHALLSERFYKNKSSFNWLSLFPHH